MKRPTSLILNNNNIPLTKTVKYLGVILDDKLAWNEHIDYAVKKCKRSFHAAKKAIGKTWGLSCQKIIWIYRTVILPKLSYGCVAWANNLNKRNIAKLSTVQHLALKSAARAHRSTSQLSLNTLFNVLPIELKLEQTAISRALSLKAEGHWLNPERSWERKEYLHPSRVRGFFRRRRIGKF